MALKNTAVKAPVGVTVLGRNAQVPTGLDSLQIPDGTAAVPGLTFRTDNPGAIRPATDVWGVATAGAERFRIDASGRFLHGSTVANAFHYIVQPAETGGVTVPPALRVDGGAHTAIAAGVEATDILLGLNRTVQFATGALPFQRAIRILAPTYAFVGASTITRAETVSINGLPTPGTNTSITTNIGLRIGTTGLTNVTTAYGLFIEGPTGATTNRAAGFSGQVFMTGTEPLLITQTVATSGSPTGISFTGGAHTTLTASTEATDVNLNLARTVQFATGALTEQRAVRIQPPTYGFVAASVITKASTFAVGGAPVAGTNATITQSYSAEFTDAVRITGTTATSFLEMDDGVAAAVSDAGEARIIYNDTAGEIQISLNGGAYTMIGGAGSDTTAFHDGGDSFGANATLGTNDTFALIFETDASEAARILTTGEFLVGVTSLTLATDQAEFRKNQAGAASNIRSVNTTDGASSSAGFSAVSTSGNVMVLGHSADSFSSSIGINSNEGFLFLGTGGDSMALVTDGTSPIRFEVNSSEVMRLPSGGGLLVGATSFTVATDVAEFVLNQNAATNIRLENTTNGTTASATLQVRASGNEFSFGHTAAAFTPVVGINADEGFISLGAGAASMGFVTRGAHPIRFSTNGDVDGASSERLRIDPVGRLLHGSTTSTAFHYIVQPAETSGTPVPGFQIDGGAHTTLTLSTEATDVNLNLARTVQFATGALTEQRAVRIQPPTYAFVAASTLTTATAVSVAGPPVAGTNATITTSYGIRVESSAVGAGVTTAYGLFSDAPTGATTNRAAGFSGNVVIDGDHDVTPTTTNEGELGTDSLKWQRVRATTIVADDYEFKGHGQDYTLFEAPEGLRLRNNKTKKTYRIKMEEINAV